jgi:leader peptidase (prepilin peptidase)/N-methyltransferase
MRFAIFAVLSVCAAGFSLAAWQRRGLVSMRSWQAVALAVVCIGVGFFAAWRLWGNLANPVAFAKFFGLFAMIQCVALVDLKQRRIPNQLLLIGLGARVICYLLEFLFYRETFFAALRSDLIGFGIGFGILFLAALVSKNSVGFGDVKLFGLIGLTAGAFGTFSTLLASLLFCSVASIFLLATKKRQKKDTLPFAPFIYFGYLAMLVLSSY